MKRKRQAKLPLVKSARVFRASGSVGDVVRVDVGTHVFIGRLETAITNGRTYREPVGVGLVEVYEVQDGLEMFQGFAEGRQRRVLGGPLLEAAKRAWREQGGVL